MEQTHSEQIHLTVYSAVIEHFVDHHSREKRRRLLKSCAYAASAFSADFKMIILPV